MLDLDTGRRRVAGDEPDLDLRRIGAVPPKVPQVSEPRGRLPDRYLAPVMLVTGRRSLEDPAAGAALQQDERPGVARRRVIRRPPSIDPSGPDLERVLRR